VAGWDYQSIGRKLGIGRSTVLMLTLGRFQFSPAAGEPCCPPELLDAVTARVAEREREKLRGYQQGVAQRLRSTANNQGLAQRLDDLGRQIENTPAAALLEWEPAAEAPAIGSAP
jgi:ribosome modulation factor